MNVETFITHLLAALGGAGGIWLWLRHVAGYLSKWEHAVQLDLGILKALVIGPLPKPMPPLVGPTHWTPAPLPTTTIPAGGPGPMPSTTSAAPAGATP